MPAPTNHSMRLKGGRGYMMLLFALLAYVVYPRHVEEGAAEHFDARHVLVNVDPLVRGVRSVRISRAISHDRYLEGVSKHVHVTCPGLAQEGGPALAHVKYAKRKRPDKRRRVVRFKRVRPVLYAVRRLHALFLCSPSYHAVHYVKDVLARGHRRDTHVDCY